MTRKALGRGLSALLGDTGGQPEAAAGASEERSFFELDLDLVRPNADQPRTSFPEAAMNELVLSIQSNGIVQPIVVRKKDKAYEIVAGERRWRAAQRAGLTKIPAVIKEVSDDKLLELALIENIQREELNPIEEAIAYRKLIDSMGFTQEVLAGRVGKDRTFIANYLRLLKLPDDIQKLVADGKLSVGHARALLSIDSADVQRQLARKIIDTAMSVRDTEKAAKRAASGALDQKAKTPVPAKQDANIKAAETKLRRHYGTQVKIMPDGRGTGGRIELEFYSESDLDRIYRLMLGK
jgi:ParB family chromosome partitioning protein